ncbi:MAG: hypothetical protein AB7O97_22890 [Planctomycetota bacterium]
MRELAMLLLLVVSAAAQDREPPVDPAGLDFEPVREAFLQCTTERAAPAALVVARRGGESLVLFAGVDASGAPLTLSSLLPLGAAARLLIADAVLSGTRGAAEADAAVLHVGDRAVTMRELLLGDAMFPDWSAFDPVEAPPDRAVLLACAEIGLRVEANFFPSRVGLAELAILQPDLLDGPTADWPTALRTRLSPAGAAVDVTDLGHLDRADAGRVAVAAEEVARCAAAAPDCARLALTLRDLQLWAEWRIRQAYSEPKGHRFGYEATVDDYPGRQVRTWSIDAPLAWSFERYLDAETELLVFGGDAIAEPVRRALVRCLFGDPPPGRQMFGGRGVGRGGPSLAPIAGEWVPVAGNAPAAPLRLDVDGDVQRRVVLFHGDRKLVQDWIGQRGEGYAVRLDGRAGGEPRIAQVLLWHTGEGEAERLRAAFVERTDRSAVPRQVDFARRR